MCTNSIKPKHRRHQCPIRQDRPKRVGRLYGCDDAGANVRHEDKLRFGRVTAKRGSATGIAFGGQTIHTEIRLPFAYTSGMFDPDANMPRINRGMVYLGACLIAGIRLARERQVNTRVIPTSTAIDESVELAHEIYGRVFRRVPAKVEGRR